LVGLILGLQIGQVGIWSTGRAQLTFLIIGNGFAWSARGEAKQSHGCKHPMHLHERAPLARKSAGAKSSSSWRHTLFEALYQMMGLNRVSGGVLSLGD
jgi:hypothetical protein